MGANSKTKQLQKYLLQRVMVLQDNMLQWAAVDSFLGEEMFHRLDQVKALKAGDTEEAVKLHNKRIECLEKALEILRNCPACGPGDEHNHAQDT